MLAYQKSFTSLFFPCESLLLVSLAIVQFCVTSFQLRKTWKLRINLRKPLEICCINDQEMCSVYKHDALAKKKYAAPIFFCCKQQQLQSNIYFSTCKWITKENKWSTYIYFIEKIVLQIVQRVSCFLHSFFKFLLHLLRSSLQFYFSFYRICRNKKMQRNENLCLSCIF